MQRGETGRARMQEGEGALVWTALQTPTFTTGNNFKDESAELFCQAFSVSNKGAGATQPCGGWPWEVWGIWRVALGIEK